MGDFLNNIIDDGKRISALAGDHTTYEKEIASKQGDLERIQAKGGYTDDAIRQALTSNGQGLLNSATEELANSSATLGKVGLEYGKRLEEKSEQLLQAWDQSKRNQQKADVANAIGTVVFLLGEFPSRPCILRRMIDLREFLGAEQSSLRARDSDAQERAKDDPGLASSAVAGEDAVVANRAFERELERR